MQSPEFHCYVGTTVYPDMQSLVLPPCCFPIGPEDIEGSSSVGCTQRKRKLSGGETSKGTGAQKSHSTPCKGEELTL